MSYGVHKVTPLQIVTMWRKFFVTLQKGQRKVKVKTTGLVHNFIILANCWNHERMSMSNGSMSYGVHKVAPPPPPPSQLFRTDAHMDGRHYQVHTSYAGGP